MRSGELSRTCAETNKGSTEDYKKLIEKILAAEEDGVNNDLQSTETLRKPTSKHPEAGKILNDATSIQNTLTVARELKDRGNTSSPNTGMGTDSDSGVSVSGGNSGKVEGQWFTKSFHIDNREVGVPTSPDYSNAKRTFSGRANSLKSASLQTMSSQSIDLLVREYFPVTLGAAYSLKTLGTHPSRFNESYKTEDTLSKGNTAVGVIKPKPSKSPRRGRPSSAHSASNTPRMGSARSSKSLDHLFLFKTEAPAIGKSIHLLCTIFQF